MTSTHRFEEADSMPTRERSNDALAEVESTSPQSPGAPESATQPGTIRYQLRYPAQAAFAATRPGAITRILGGVDG